MPTANTTGEQIIEAVVAGPALPAVDRDVRLGRVRRGGGVGARGHGRTGRERVGAGTLSSALRHDMPL